jgi:hypothetical protein
MSISSADKALYELFTGAFFFAMRSYEYVAVSGTRKIKLPALQNIHFFKGRKQLEHNDILLHLAISITFQLQKCDTKTDIITQHKSSDPILCPVKIWVKIVHRIFNYKNSSKNSTENTFAFPD